MRAVMRDRYGPPDVPRLDEVDRPVPPGRTRFWSRSAGVLAAWLGTRIGLHDVLWLGAIRALSAPILLLTGSLTRARAGQAPLPNPAAQ